MGYQRKDGKYVGDDGKLYANYNDALAQANSLRGRAAVEQALAETQQQISDRQGTLGVHQFLQRNIGAPLGFGGAWDSGNQSLNKELRGLESQQRVLTNTLNDYRRRMGEGEPVPDASGRDDQGADLDMEFIRGLKDQTASSPPPAPSLPPGGNPLGTTPIVDRNAERDAVYKQMMQQYGGNTAQEAFGLAPRSNEIGYSDRADIQAWMQANAGTPMVEKFMAEQRAKGLVNEGQQLSMPQGDSSEAVESREQAARVGRDGRTMLQAAQSAVNSVQSDEIAQLRASEAQNEALQFGNKIGEPGEMNRMQLFGMQNVSEQMQKSENSFQQGMQPFSARAAEVGVELADPFDLFNRPMNGKNFLDLYRVRP